MLDNLNPWEHKVAILFDADIVSLGFSLKKVYAKSIEHRKKRTSVSSTHGCLFEPPLVGNLALAKEFVMSYIRCTLI